MRTGSDVKSTLGIPESLDLPLLVTSFARAEHELPYLAALGLNWHIQPDGIKYYYPRSSTNEQKHQYKII